MSALTRRPFRHAKSKSGLAAMFLIMGHAAAPASADEAITVDVDGVLFAPAGTRTTITEQEVNPTNVGQRCVLSVLSQNQSSVHAGNDLVVTTAGIETTIADVEAEPDASRDMSAEILMGPSLSVDLLMGADGVSSFGFDLSVNCPPVDDTPVPTEEPAVCEPDEPVTEDDVTEGDVTEDSGSTEPDAATDTEPGLDPDQTPIDDCAKEPGDEPVADEPVADEPAEEPFVESAEPTPEPIKDTPTQRTPTPEEEPTTGPFQSTPEPTITVPTVPEPLSPIPVATPTPRPIVPDPSELQVLGILVERELPSSAPATAIPVTPKYNG